MRNLDTSINVADYLEYGCNTLLPKAIRERFNGKQVLVHFDNYPCSEKSATMKDWKGYAKQVAAVNSPKTYGDLVKPYCKNAAKLIKAIDNGKLPNWDYIHTTNCLWVERIAIEGTEVELYIGS